MDTPLPDNLTPEGFKCVRIWYPDDPGYRRAVMGAVSYLQNWFAWERDEAKSGAIAAQKFREAYTLTVADILAGKTCGDTSENGGNEIPPPEVIYIGGGTIESEDNMGQVVTEVKKVGNELWIYYGHCCIDKIPLVIEGGADESEPNPLDDPDDETQTWHACGKASGLIDALRAMIDTGLAYYTSPFSFTGEVKNSVPTAQMTTSALYLLLFDFTTITKTVLNDEIVNDDLVQTMKCLAAPALEDTPDVTDDELGSVIAAVKTAIFQEHTYVTAELVWTLWEQCWQVLGNGDSKMLMKLGAADDTADCTCPGSDPIIAGSIWFDGTYQSGAIGSDFVVELIRPEYSGRRVLVKLATYGYGNKSFANVELNLAGAQGGDTVTIRVYPRYPDATNSNVAADQPDLSSKATVEQWRTFRIDGAPHPPTRVNYDGYYEITSTAPVGNELPQYVETSGYKAPIEISENWYADFYLEIVAINGERLGDIGP